MSDELSIIFRTVRDVFSSDLVHAFLFLGIGLGNLFVFVDFLKRMFYSHSYDTKQKKQESEYFDSDSFNDPWEIPDKKI